MEKCKFCQRKFRSPQAVKAHLKHCSRYKTLKSKKAGPLGRVPQAPATPAAMPLVQSSPPIAAPDLTAPLLEFMKSIRELSTKQNAPQTPQQQRRKVLQAAKERIIDHYRTPLGPVTSAMRGAAKTAIERELATLPLEEFPFDEVCELVIAIRERCYAPTFKRQAQEAEHQNTEHEARRRKQIEEMAACHWADRRKTTLIDQAIGQTGARCEAKGIIGHHRLSVLVDIESRLTELLIGSESVPDAYGIIQTVVDTRVAEAEAKQEAARAKADEQWREEIAAVLVLGAVVGLVVLSLKYPVQALPILNWIERTFRLAPGADAGAPTRDVSETSQPAASTESRPPSKRRRKDPVAPSSTESPWTHSVGQEGGHA